jgi:acid stress-induced BolA-like protein IbaG/YrbA
MATAAARVEALLREAADLAPLAHLEVIDASGGACEGAKLEVLVVTERFEGMALLARHRAVQAATAPAAAAIHALSIKALTPAQYEQRKAAGTL